VDHLTDLARRMCPDDPARPWAKVAKLTFSTLLNDGRPHEARWAIWPVTPPLPCGRS
jgi:hypothetical protein